MAFKTAIGPITSRLQELSLYGNVMVVTGVLVVLVVTMMVMVMVVTVMVGGDAVDCKGASKQPGCGSLPAKQCCGFSSNATTIAASTSTGKYQIHIHKWQIPVHLYHKLHDLIYS